MRPKHEVQLADRVARAAEAALAAKSFVSATDILVGVGWLDAGALERWRRGQIDFLERAVQANLNRISEAMRLFRSWAAANSLSESETAYVSRTPQRQTLRFSVSGDASIEAAYRTHWVSPELSARKRERLAEKASASPELVVVLPRNKDWKCHRCGRSGDFLMMEATGPACLQCVGLGDLEYLPAGDALITRRAKAASARYAVVVYFSRNRSRYERQGLLVEPKALAEAKGSVDLDGQRRVPG